MKRLTAFILAFLIALSLVACGTPPPSVTDAPPESAEPVLQGDAGFNKTEDDELVLGQAEITTPRQEDESFFVTESISVDVTAANVYVLNADTNSILYQKNSDERIAPASTVKILTALTVLEYCALDDVFTVGSEIDLIAADSSRAWLNKGEKLSVRQLLVALLLPSGNDAAYTLAVNAGKRIADKDNIGTRQAIEIFVDVMNEKANEVGAVSSHFLNPDGYDADGQYTTAYDLAQIAKACLDYDTLREIMGSYKISDTWINGREVTYTNTNELLNPESRYYCPSVVGLKTGSTTDAGSCIVSAADINGQTYICVVMGSFGDIRFSDSITVFNAINPTVTMPQVNKAAPATAPGEQRRR